MAGRQSRARKVKPGSPRIRDTDPVDDPADSGTGSATASEPWFTTVPGSVDPAAANPPRPPRQRTPRSAGPEKDEAEQDDPERDDPESVARLICLRMLTAAPRTQAELAAALRRRGVPDDAAQAVLSRFAEVKLIDDEMFARAWVESRHHGRGLAGRALGAELRQRGVATDDIESALSRLNPEQELATARELVERRLTATAGMALPARMRRLTGV